MDQDSGEIKLSRTEKGVKSESVIRILLGNTKGKAFVDIGGQDPNIVLSRFSENGWQVVDASNDSNFFYEDDQDLVVFGYNSGKDREDLSRIEGISREFKINNPKNRLVVMGSTLPSPEAFIDTHGRGVEETNYWANGPINPNSDVWSLSFEANNAVLKQSVLESSRSRAGGSLENAKYSWVSGEGKIRI